MERRGATVRVSGLATDTEVNGKLGVTLSLDTEPGEELYYVICLFPGTQVVSLRQCHITAVPTPVPECMWSHFDSDTGHFPPGMAHIFGSSNTEDVCDAPAEFSDKCEWCGCDGEKLFMMLCDDGPKASYGDVLCRLCAEQNLAQIC